MYKRNKDGSLLPFSTPGWCDMLTVLAIIAIVVSIVGSFIAVIEEEYAIILWPMLPCFLSALLLIYLAKLGTTISYNTYLLLRDYEERKAAEKKLSGTRS